MSPWWSQGSGDRLGFSTSHLGGAGCRVLLLSLVRLPIAAAAYRSNSGRWKRNLWAAPPRSQSGSPPYSDKEPTLREVRRRRQATGRNCRVQGGLAARCLGLPPHPGSPGVGRVTLRRQVVSQSEGDGLASALTPRLQSL